MMACNTLRIAVWTGVAALAPFAGTAVMAQEYDAHTHPAARGDIQYSRYPEETLRVINGMHPVGEPRAGDYIKIVQ